MDNLTGTGVEGLKRLISTWRANFPESRAIIKVLIAEDDKVVTHYVAQMTAATTTTGIWIDRVLENRIVESWVDWDRLGLFQQLGFLPKRGQADS